MYAYIDRKKNYLLLLYLELSDLKEIKISLEFLILAEEIKVSKTGIKKYIGRRIGCACIEYIGKDFVDEDTGEVVSIERNEIILDRDTIIEKIM